MAAFEEILSRDGRIVYRTRGVSMEPILRQNRDLVIIETTPSRLRPLDVALYRRGSSYVLHRVIRVEEDHYLIRGDNTYTLEKVPDSAVLGVLTGFQRKGREYSTKNIGYRAYALCWNAAYPLRSFCIRGRRLAVRIAGKTGILPLLRRAAEKTDADRNTEL